jgi:hypothetical protein
MLSHLYWYVMLCYGMVWYGMVHHTTSTKISLSVTSDERLPLYNNLQRVVYAMEASSSLVGLGGPARHADV